MVRKIVPDLAKLVVGFLAAADGAAAFSVAATRLWDDNVGLVTFTKGSSSRFLFKPMPAASEFGAAFSFFLNNYYLFRILQSQIYIINYLQDYLILCPL